MKQEGHDDLLKEKMDRLDALSAGIVYGKEEAWERLQQRMEHKPAKRITVKYRLAAAAMLLLFVCVTAVYYYPSNEIANNKVEKKYHQANNTAVTIPQMPATVYQLETIQERKVSRAIENVNRQISSIAAKNKRADQPGTIEPFVQTLPNEIITGDNVVMTNTPAPVTPSPKAMKTVHINELDNREPEQLTNMVAVNARPKMDLRNLPVVHINDVIHEEYEVRRIIKESRSLFVHISFMQRGFKYNDPADTDDDLTPHNFLKIKFNTQN